MWTPLVPQIPFGEAITIVLDTKPLWRLYRLLIEGIHARQLNEKRPPKLFLDEIEVPLEDFERRWSTSASHPDPGPESEIITKMAEALAHGTLKDMARIFHQTCPGDWSLGDNVVFGVRLRSFYEHEEGKEHAPMLAATIQFRWEMGLLTDYLISLFGLPMPCNKICALWDPHVWQDAMNMIGNTWRVRWDRVENALGKSFDVLPREDQGPSFDRSRWYLTAALVEANGSENENLAIVSAVCEFTEILKEFHYENYVY